MSAVPSCLRLAQSETEQALVTFTESTKLALERCHTHTQEDPWASTVALTWHASIYMYKVHTLHQYWYRLLSVCLC